MSTKTLIASGLSGDIVAGVYTFAVTDLSVFKTLKVDGGSESLLKLVRQKYAQNGWEPVYQDGKEIFLHRTRRTVTPAEVGIYSVEGACAGSVSLWTQDQGAGEDGTPAAFSFTDQTGVAVSTVIESAAVAITGFDTATFTVTGGSAEKNGSGSWVTSGFLCDGDTVKLRGTSSASNSTAVNVVLTVGGVSDTFTITTVGA